MTVAARSPLKSTPLLVQVAAALDAEGVQYCQWKGHYKQSRWLAGEGDIDLLFAQESWPRWVDVLYSTGFRLTASPEDARLMGTVHYRAWDPETGNILHIHVHTRLVIETARGFVYRLPLEAALLAGSRSGALFRTPPPELEALVVTLRTTLRWASWRKVPDGTREELAYLEGLADRSAVLAAASRHLPSVDPAIISQCRRALEPGRTLWDRWRARRALTRALKPFEQPPPLGRRIAHMFAAAAWHIRGGNRTDNGARLSLGGRLIAFSGTDGSGKSTCVAALASWLKPHIQVMTAHVGRPPRSFLTLCVGALRLVLPLRALFWARLLCTARDRSRLVARAWRFTLQGGVALAERYPMGPNQLMVGPWIRHNVGEPMPRLAKWMAEREEDYYARMPRPDRVFVLDVHPDIAVRRKTDEPAGYVRARAEVSRRIDWSGTPVRHVDADQPLPVVLANLRELLWGAL